MNLVWLSWLLVRRHKVLVSIHTHHAFCVQEIPSGKRALQRTWQNSSSSVTRSSSFAVSLEIASDLLCLQIQNSNRKRRSSSVARQSSRPYVVPQSRPSKAPWLRIGRPFSGKQHHWLMEEETIHRRHYLIVNFIPFILIHRVKPLYTYPLSSFRLLAFKLEIFWIWIIGNTRLITIIFIVRAT